MFSSTPSFSSISMTSRLTRARWISTPTRFIAREELARNGQASRVFSCLVASLLPCILLLSKLPDFYDLLMSLMLSPTARMAAATIKPVKTIPINPSKTAIIRPIGVLTTISP